jgi:hypothetical protein
MRSRLQERFQHAVRELLAEAGSSEPPPAFSLEVPRTAEHGDFACNAALLLAKPLRRPPREIAQRYGLEFIEIIKKYVEEKDIIRPLDMVVKSVVNKSGMKVYIIQSIDVKRSLEDIAEAKGLEMGELLSEVEAIVNSGTRINLDYYINSVMDEERQNDIYSYFREEAETDSLEEAIKELGNEFEEEEIRLMRIKFLSEMGN